MCARVLDAEGREEPVAAAPASDGVRREEGGYEEAVQGHLEEARRDAVRLEGINAERFAIHERVVVGDAKRVEEPPVDGARLLWACEAQ